MSNPFDTSNPGLTGISGKPLLSSEWSVGSPFPNACRYFFVASTGDITIARASDGGSVTYPGVQAGSWLFVGASQIVATTIASPTTNIIPHE